MARIIVCGWSVQRMLGGALLLCWPVAAARAQVPVSPSAGNNTAHTGAHTGIVHPQDHLDPGIAKSAPAMSPQSTPVIHPPRTRQGPRGKVVVVPR